MFKGLLDCFIGELKTEICRDVIAQSPNSLTRLVSLAKLFEEIYSYKSKYSYTTQKNQIQALNTNLSISQTLKSISLLPLLPTPTNSNPKNFNVKRMTSAEIQLRREKRLCFTCDEKYSPAHKCPNK